MEIDAALDTLMAAHTGFNNFYKEPAPTRTLAALVGGDGRIPDAVLAKYVRVVVKAFIGNGYGVSGAAVPYYERMIGGFDPRQAARALRAFTDPEVYSVLRSAVGVRQWGSLAYLARAEANVARRQGAVRGAADVPRPAGHAPRRHQYPATGRVPAEPRTAAPLRRRAHPLLVIWFVPDRRLSRR